MGGRNCCVVSCRRKSHDHHGRKIPNGLTFHCFPAWRTSEGEQISRLTETRRAAWVAAVGRSDITFDHIPSSMRICSRHFHSGKPAYEMLQSDPDWVPSLNLIPSTGITRRTERLLPPVQVSRDKTQKSKAKTRPSLETEPAPAAATTTTTTPAEGEEGVSQRPASRPWREVKSLLQSALQRKTTFNKQPAKNTGLAFRDLFKGALEASLEAHSRSRALSAQQRSDSGEYSMELSFKLPALEEESQACETCCSSCCLNYAKLQKRVTVLEEKVTRLTELREAMDASPFFNKAPCQPEQELQRLETSCTEEDDPAWMEPLSPSQMAENDPNTEWIQENNSSKGKPRRARFNQAWLKMFWFLRYSPSQDMMWCHVCRLHSEKTHQYNSLISGSRVFKFHNIKKHSSSKLHEENVSRYKLQVCDLQL
ncbi:uncharacterized protein LOC131972943 [Centropristis striata]|uniref:uncharacterized protein LOC131972943 n=1 Tax=Centropristis striata TaxID=184440 RepID=UPI0027E1ABB3|nr:uncharacterized protein LOC131972943 [Centropristis striata]